MKVYSILVILFSSSLFSQAASAGGCHLEEVSPGKMYMSEHLANLVRNKLLQVEKDMNARGEELNVVMIARMGESLNKFRLIKDDPSKSLQEYMDYLWNVQKANQQGRLVDANGKKIQPSKTPRLPKEFFSDKKLEYSHVGFLIKRDQLKDRKPETEEWIYVVHLLAECDEKSKRYGQSKIFFETFEQFFWDTEMLKKGENDNQALLVVPQPEIQKNLYRLLHDAGIGENGLHTPKYNVAAMPFTMRKPKNQHKAAPAIYQTRDQNSNQWPVEMLTTAARQYGEIINREQAQDQMIKFNYRPSIVDPEGFKNNVACKISKGHVLGNILGVFKMDGSNLINCDYQYYMSRQIVHVITVDSILDYMTRNSFFAQDPYQANQPAVYEVSASKEDLEALDTLGKIDEKLAKRMKAKKTGVDVDAASTLTEEFEAANKEDVAAPAQ